MPPPQLLPGVFPGQRGQIGAGEPGSRPGQGKDKDTHVNQENEAIKRGESEGQFEMICQ
jgi:hypothetical protein